MQTQQSQIDAEQKLVPAIYGRYKGAEWFDLLYRKNIMILGQGGIGSWVSLLLSRNGANLFLYDMDRFEAHNGGQVMFRYDINKLKTEAMEATINDFSPDCRVQTFGEYTACGPANQIMLCAFDNFAARRIAFENWLRYVETFPEQERRYLFFQDGRLLAEQLGIFNIPGDRPDLIERYQTEYLFDDAEVDPVSCTLQQTTFMAAMIAAKMIGFLSNWITNASSDLPARKVPFYHQYFAPVNLTLEI